jgi:putative redox protein
MDDPLKEVFAEWQGDLSFLGQNQSGGQVQMGSLGNDPGISPMELVLIGLAGCTGIDVVSTLRKQRQQLENLKVQVRGKRAESHPRVYTDIEITYLLWGKGLKQEAIERAIRLSEEKYCSVSAMMQATARIRTSYQIFIPDEHKERIVHKLMSKEFIFRSEK